MLKNGGFQMECKAKENEIINIYKILKKMIKITDSDDQLQDKIELKYRHLMSIFIQDFRS